MDGFGHRLSRFLFATAPSDHHPAMHLMYTLNENGDRVYTLKVLVKLRFLSPGLSPFENRK